jgi:hypothetical protein
MRRIDLRTVPIAIGPAVAKLLWPTFFEFAGCVFADCAASSWIIRASRRGEAGPASWEPDRTGAEALENHVHVIDEFRHPKNVWSEKRSTYRLTHPAFRAAEQLGRLMAESWFAKLKQDFPNDNFRVYFGRRDNPIVRFHRVYAGEPPWLDADDFAAQVQKREIVVLDTRA